MDLHDSNQGRIEIISFRFLGKLDVYGEAASGNGKDGTSIKIGGEFLSIKCGGCDEEF
jgi:hypothetical protein